MQLVIINYLLLMYIVTSKPKRMSLYSGVCQFILLSPWLILRVKTLLPLIMQVLCQNQDYF